MRTKFSEYKISACAVMVTVSILDVAVNSKGGLHSHLLRTLGTGNISGTCQASGEQSPLLIEADIPPAAE
jgi:hypothetical protein